MLIWRSTSYLHRHAYCYLAHCQRLPSGELAAFARPALSRNLGCAAGALPLAVCVPGMRSFGYSLSTSLQRLGGNYHELEHHLLRNFRKYARDTTTPLSATVWDWLALAQHHGLPTRLLDWTYSPYVALHFATDDLNAYHQDGIIWALNYVKAAEHLPPALRDAPGWGRLQRIYFRAPGTYRAQPEHSGCFAVRALRAFSGASFARCAHCAPVCAVFTYEYPGGHAARLAGAAPPNCTFAFVFRPISSGRCATS